MDIARVSAALSVLNGNDNTNSRGNCEQMAVAAGEALVSGVAPGGLCPQNTPHAAQAAQQYGKQRVRSFKPDIASTDGGDPTSGTYGWSVEYLTNGHTRAYRVWSWLKHEAVQGVYVFAQDDDHVYNFVLDDQLYLVDSTTQIYKRIRTPGDCSVLSVPYSRGFETATDENEGRKSSTKFGFNYLSPQPLSFTDKLKIYYWGALHANWQ